MSVIKTKVKGFWDCVVEREMKKAAKETRKYFSIRAIRGLLVSANLFYFSQSFADLIANPVETTSSPAHPFAAPVIKESAIMKSLRGRRLP
jgi:hypothetical protein